MKCLFCGKETNTEYNSHDDCYNKEMDEQFKRDTIQNIPNGD